MQSFFVSNLTKIFFLFCFLFLTPLMAQASTCTDNGGTCVESTICSSADLAAFNDCATGESCCKPSSITYEEGSTGGFLSFEGHLVPCGRSTDDLNTSGEDETEPCTLCHLFIMLKRIFDLMLSLIIIVSILLITVGGVVYIVSAGSPKLIGIAKNIITKTLIGFGLMLVGWILVYTLLVFLSTQDMVGTGSGSWFEFTCETTSSFQTP